VTRLLKVEVSDAARRQIDAAELWWRQNRERVPNAIREELVRVGDLLSFQPHVGVRARNVKLRGVRRIHIERIHYDLYYRVLGSPPESIEIIAFWSSFRGSGPRL
jgi:plasmid stabilization system protein ParE